MVAYRITDVDTDASSAHMWFNGVYIEQGGSVVATAAQLSNLVLFAGSKAGTDALQVEVFNGSTWSSAKDISVVTLDHAPVVTGAPASSDLNQTIAFSSLFAVSDADGDAITQYRVTDATAGGSYLQLNGVTQAENVAITLTAAQLAQLQVQTGTTNGANNFIVQAFDGTTWSSSTTVALTTVGSAPTPPVVNVTGSLDLSSSMWMSLSAASLPFAVTDADGNPVVTYRFTDVGTDPNSTHLWFSDYSGGYLPQGGTVEVAADQLPNLWIQGGSTSGIDTLQVQVFDGHAWSSPETVSVVTHDYHYPIVSGAPASFGLGQSTAFSSLLSVWDPDGDVITEYKITDGTVGGAHLTLNGVQQGEGSAVTLTAAQFAQLQVQTSLTSGTNDFIVQAFDGTNWSTPTTVTLTSTNTVHNPAVVTVNDALDLSSNEWLNFNSSTLPFTVSDPDGNPVLTYRFTDVGTDPNSAHLWFASYPGGYLPQGGTIDVAASQLSNFWIQGGSATGAESLQIQVYDGYTWSAAQQISIVPGTQGALSGAADAPQFLNGTAGSDTFAFAANFGNAAITNYTPGQDSIALDHSIFATTAAVLANTTNDPDGNAVIRVDAHDSITLIGISQQTLAQHQSDFHFV